MIPAPSVQVNGRQGERVLPSLLTQAFLLPGLSMPLAGSGSHLILGVSSLQSSISPWLMQAQDTGSYCTVPQLQQQQDQHFMVLCTRKNTDTKPGHRKW